MSKANKNDKAKWTIWAWAYGGPGASWPTLPLVPANEARRFEYDLKAAKWLFRPSIRIEAEDPMMTLEHSAPASYQLKE